MRAFDSGNKWYTTPYSQLSGFSEVTIGSGPDFIDATLFMATEFTLIDIDEYAAFKVFISHRMGFILYLNGVEFFRKFLPESDVKYTTLANDEYETTQNIELILPSVHLKEGKNTLSIEVHRKAITDASKRLIYTLYGSKMEELEDGCVIISKPEYSEISDSFGEVSGGNVPQNAMDNNPITKWWVRNGGIGEPTKAWISISFSPNTYGWFNQIGWRSVDDINSAGAGSQPSRMSFYGLYNGKWEALDSINNIVVRSESQKFVYHHMDNTKLYTGFNFSVDAVKESRSELKIGDFFVGACQKFYCDADGGYPATSSGIKVSVQCKPGKVGTMIRQCGEGKNPSWGESDESRCKDAPPSNLRYSKDSYFLVTYQEFEERLIPTVVYLGKLTYEIFPTLPNGLKFNNETGEIYSTPLSKMNATVYTVRATDPITLIGIETTLEIQVTALFCPANGLYMATMGGEISTIGCDNGFAGHKQRKCEDGVLPKWGEEENLCIDKRNLSTGNIILISVLSVCSLIAVGAVSLCCYGKYKASQRKTKRVGLASAGSGTAAAVSIRNASSRRGQKSVRL